MFKIKATYQHYLKSVISCSIASILLFITPVRRHLGVFSFQTLLTTAFSHSTIMTMGANLEFQIQQLLLSILVSLYIIIIQVVVFGLGEISQVHFETMSRLVRAFGLCIFCILVSLVFVYMPRLTMATKLNALSVYLAMTRHSVRRHHFTVRPVPSNLYGQLIGAGISTLVNLLVMPMTSSRQLVGSLVALLKEMDRTYRYFHINIKVLGEEKDPRAQVLRADVRWRAEKLGRVVNGSRYEITIERFSQLDYHRIWHSANQLAGSLSTMCLPFEIDNEVFQQHPRIKQGSMTNPSGSRVSLHTSRSPSAVHTHRRVKSNEDSKMSTQSLSEWAHINSMEVSRQKYVDMATNLLKGQLELHSQVIEMLMRRFRSMEEQEGSFPTIFHLILRSFRVFGSTASNDQTSMTLLEIYEMLKQHTNEFRTSQSTCVRMMLYPAQNEQHVILLSFIGAVEENAQRLCDLVMVLHQIDQQRSDQIRVWFPKLSWAWLYHGRLEDRKEVDILQEEEEQITPSYQISNPYVHKAAQILDLLRRPKLQYVLKFTLTMMVWSLWSFLSVSQEFFRHVHGTWGLACIGTIFGVTIGSTFHAGLIRILGVSISGGWAIVTWLASHYGRHPYLPCFCCIVYFVVAFYIKFFVQRWGLAGPVMIISFASVLFTAYSRQQRKSTGTVLGWKLVAVNVVAILFTFLVSALLFPNRARTALKRQVAMLFHLNSQIIQSINHIHLSRQEFPTVHRNEQKRVEDLIEKSRGHIQRCRGVLVAARREPSLHQRFQATPYRQLIDTLELQLEWLLYSYSSNTAAKESSNSLKQVALDMREDIVGAKISFNNMLAGALYTGSRLPAYLPDIATARRQFIEHTEPAADCSFEITYLCRWNMGFYHIITSQSKLCSAVRAIVGAETDAWPEDVGFMLDTLEQAADQTDQDGYSGQWFSRLPKYSTT